MATSIDLTTLRKTYQPPKTPTMMAAKQNSAAANWNSAPVDRMKRLVSLVTW